MAKAVGNVKRCGRCQHWKNVGEYGPDGSRTDRLQVYCRDCQAAKRQATPLKRDLAAQVTELEGTIQWLVLNLPDLLPQAHLDRIRERFEDDTDLPTFSSWPKAIPDRSKSNGAWGGLTDEEIQAMVMPRNDPQPKNSESNP
jgi:hypothetical protein